MTPYASVTLSSDLLGSMQDAGAGTTITVRIAPADRDSWLQDVLERIGSRPAVDIQILSAGSDMRWHNDQSPVTITIPYAPSGDEAGDTERLIIVYINGENTVTVSNGRYDAETGQMKFSTTHLSQYAVEYAPKTFADLTRVEWARHAIQVLAAKGVINGTSANTYTPQAEIKRADFVMLLLGVLELKAKTALPFKDVQEHAYYADAVGMAGALGIALGTGDERFLPDRPITREEAAVFVERALKAKEIPLPQADPSILDAFKDKHLISAYASDSMAVAVESGLLKGYDGRLNPKGHLTRAEAAVLMYRIYNM